MSMELSSSKKSFSSTKNLGLKDGYWVTGQELSSDDEPPNQQNLPNLFPTFHHTSFSALFEIPSLTGTQSFVLNDTLKSPGLDGLNPLFYQNQWSLNHPRIIFFIHNIFKGEPLEPNLSKTPCLHSKDPKPGEHKIFSPYQPLQCCL